MRPVALNANALPMTSAVTASRRAHDPSSARPTLAVSERGFNRAAGSRGGSAQHVLPDGARPGETILAFELALRSRQPTRSGNGQERLLRGVVAMHRRHMHGFAGGHEAVAGIVEH